MTGILLLTLTLPLPLRAQESATTQATVPAETALTQQDITSLRRQIAEQELDEQTVTLAAGNLEEAERLLSKARDFQVDLAQITTTIAGAPEQTEALRDRLDEPTTVPSVTIPEDASVAELETQLQEAEAKLQELQTELQQKEAELKSRQGLQTRMTTRLEEAREKLQDVTTRLTAGARDEEPAPISTTRLAKLRAQKQALESEIDYLQKALGGFSAVSEMLQSRRNLLARQTQQQQAVVDQWERAVTGARQRKATEEARKAQQDVARAAEQHALVQQAAEQRQELAELARELNDRISRLNERSREVKQQQERLEAELRRAREYVEKAGLTESIGQVLQNARKDLRKLRFRKTDQAERRKAIQQAWLRLDELQRRYEQLDVTERVEAMTARLPADMPEAKRRSIRDLLEEILIAKKKLLNPDVDVSVTANAREYYDALQSAESAEQSLSNTIDEYSTFIDEHILWFPSTRVIGAQHIGGTVQAVGWLMAPSNWTRLGAELLDDAAAAALLYGLMLVLLGLWVVSYHRSRKTIEEMGGRVARSQTDSFYNTIKVILLTVWLAGVVPGLLAFLGWRLSVMGCPFCLAIGRGLTVTSVWTIISLLVIFASMPDGLANKHFRWSATSQRIIHRIFMLGLVLVAPPVFLTGTLAAQGNDLYNSSLGRFAFIAAMLVIGWLLFMLIRPGGTIMRRLLSSDGSWLHKLRYIWFPLLLAFPVVLAILAAAGYFYTARQLGGNLIATIWLLLAIAGGYGLMGRVLFLLRRKLAIERARKMREAEEKTATEGAPESPGEPAVVEPEVSLLQLSEQTRRLIRTLVAVFLIIGLWAIWGRLLPALRIFESITLWESSTNGQVEIISLANLFSAIVILIVAIIAARDIPAVLEMAVLQHLPLEDSVRFAISTVSRYTINIVGIVLAFMAIGIGWAKVQWLAAAITVGLGFGLQEIFANFISGLILLFERPMRIGDVVTVGEVSGTVTKIRMRATTITDWDRKELVVPNKEFITGRLVNWSLSDNILRLTISVGVAYGSDTDRAKELLLQVARENPNVLEEPEPGAFFEQFGDSSLLLNLRVFTINRRSLLITRDELHGAIDKKFKQAGIEIAFPQRDLHVRSIDTDVLLRHAKQNAEQETSE
ncbi:MAG: mechanosensitive ion channel domain-containing protein [Phycisphaerae bacterium]